MSSETADGRPLVRQLFADRLGRVSVRSLQIIIIVTLGCVVVYALVQVKLVVIPALIALIIAAAIGPVVNWLRRHGVPSILATWIVILAGLLLFGGVGWLIVFAVKNQWSQLVKSISDGLDQLQHFLTHGPLPIDQDQLENARKSITDFVTSAQFGAGALTGVSVATQLITAAVLGFVIMFFFVKDGNQIWNFCLRPLHGRQLDRGRRIGHTVLETSWPATCAARPSSRSSTRSRSGRDSSSCRYHWPCRWPSSSFSPPSFR